MADAFPERIFARARELESNGLDRLLADGVAWLEERIRQWPPAWGEDLHILIYGDFQVLDSALMYPTIGITVHPEKKNNTIIRGAITVLEATVKIEGKSVPALIDATSRINLLLGAYTLHEWGNAGCGWWSYVTHDSGSSVSMKLTREGIEQSTAAVRNLSPEIRRKIEAAMFWVREPRNMVLESYRPDVLRVYSAYWNAFECLVEAVNILTPCSSPSKTEKQAKIDHFVQSRGGRLTAADVEDCYRTLVNPGFVNKASHALNVCFGHTGDSYANECFRLSPRKDRLYDIRNAINHGDIDAENPNELLRVQARLPRLWMIIWRMFGHFIPFPTPVDSKYAA